MRLAPGAHKVEGRFLWDRTPDSLPVPSMIAIVDLSVEGRPVPVPRRDEGGLLLLRQGGAEGAGGENLQLKVFRKIADGIPIFIETRLLFDVSGKAREVVLGGALLAGAVPVAVTGDLPARLDRDGTLRVQVRAGTFTVRVEAVASGRPDAFSVPKAAPPWPPQEVWVFAAAERLRQVEITGAPAIDASRTDLPQEWRQLPAFQLAEPGQLKLRETRRGEPDALPDQIVLNRRLWLDEDGRAFTVRDAFSGRLGRTSRLNALAPAELGRVAIDGAGQLITSDPGAEGAAGVELRQAALRLEADSRLPRSGAVAAVGWALNVQSLKADLLLPPGWRLLATTGVDEAPGSWISGWDLWGFFFVLVTAMGVFKLFGPRWGALALVTLVLLHGEAGAPRLVWLSLLVTLAVMNAAPPGVLRKLAGLAWALSLLVFVVEAAPFVVRQIRTGLFPQVAQGRGAVPDQFAASGSPACPFPLSGRAVRRTARVRTCGGADAGLRPAANYPGPSRAGPASPHPVGTPAARLNKEEAQRVTNELAIVSQGMVQKAYEQDPHAVIQTGAGVPTWTWASYRLTWSGPVAKDQRMRLWLLSPAANALLAFLRIGLTVLLAVRLAAAILGGPRFKGGLSVGAALVAVVVLLSPAAASAQDEERKAPLRGDGGPFPSAELLQELKKRMTRPPACAPHCVTTANVRLVVEGAELRFQAEVHAGALGAWPLPGPAASWVPRSVSLDGVAAEGQIARLADGFLHLRVPAGTHQVALAGPLPPQDSLTLQFGERPRRASASAQGWQVDGIRDDGSADDSVQLSRKLAATAAGASGAAAGYEPWLEVTRVLDIGVSWNVLTIVRRVSPPGAPVVVKVPLLKGMLVTDAEHQVKDGEVLVTLGRDQMEARWSATLPAVEGATVALKAPEGKPWSEVWVVACGIVWQCEANGLAPVSRLREGRLAPEFRPWPGESLNLTFRRPKGLEGRTMTIDRVSLRLSPGPRLEDATLDMQVRASRGGPLVLTLPEGAEVQSLKVKGVDRPIRPDGSKLTLTLDPGEQPVKVAWRTTGGLGIGYRAPAVNVGGPAVNAQVSVDLPEDRWLLYARGPAWGPADPLLGHAAVRRHRVGRALADSAHPAHDRGVGPSGSRPDPDLPRGRSDRGGMVPRAGLASRPRPRTSRPSRPGADRPRDLDAPRHRLPLCRRAAGPGPPPRHAGRGRREHRHAAPVVPGSHRWRPAPALRPERPPLGVSPDHAGVVALAGPAAPPLAALGLGQLHERQPLASPARAEGRASVRGPADRASDRPGSARGRMTRSTARA